jgi:putative FmdB family regulatory protein
MPTYEYACTNCDHQWEHVQRITEAPLETCPKCSKASAHRLISGGTRFILKGGGWYSDLYASPKAKPSEAGSAAGSSKEGASKDRSSKEGASKEGASKEGEGASSKGGNSAKTGGSTGASSKDGAASGEGSAKTGAKTGTSPTGPTPATRSA